MKLLKEHRRTMIITSIVILIPVLIGLCLWNRLPDRIAIHFNMNNEPDGWSGKPFTVFGIPLILLALQWICLFGTGADPKKQNISFGMLEIVLWIIPAVSLLVSVLTYGWALGWEMDIGMIVCVFMGIVFIVLGNYLPKNAQSYTMGIKLPWTLASEENWRRTHRLGGFVFCGCGVGVMLSALLGAKWLALVWIAAAVVIPMAYSYALSRKGI